MDRRAAAKPGALCRRLTFAATLCIVLGLCAAAEAKTRTRNVSVDPHCTPDASAPASGRQFKCSIPGPGKFDIQAEATFKDGANAEAALAIQLDGQACGKSETAKFSGRGDVYGSCAMKKLGAGDHEVKVSVDYAMAAYDDLHVTVVEHDAVPRHDPTPLAKGGFSNGR